MPGLYKLGVINTDMNTIQRRAYRLPVDTPKIAAVMPLHHDLPFGRYTAGRLFLHLHIKQRRAVNLLGAHLEVILVVGDQAGELPVAVGARVEAGVELVQGVAHVVEARPAVFLLGNFVGLADDWHRVVFVVWFGDGRGSSGGRGSAGEHGNAGGRGGGRRRFPARAFSRRGNP